MSGHSLMRRNKIKILGVIIFQLIVCILMGTQKKSFFCDEIYSYGLANSEEYSFIDPETARQYSETGWVDRKYFEEYLQVSQAVPFSFRAAFENQKNDVHPPLYYCILHVFSLLNQGIFSKWTGLALNFVFLIFTDVMMLYIAVYLTKDIKVSLAALLFWTFSGAGLSNVLFIRMYVMLTCEMLVYVTIHIRFLEEPGMRNRDMIAMLLTVACGGLTHYYFYVFVFCFSVPVCVCFWLWKDHKKIFQYGISICAGAGIAFCIFPKTLEHVFWGYRGREVIGNLALGRDGKVGRYYLQSINDSMFAGRFQVWLCVVLLLTMVCFIAKYCVRIEWTFHRENRYVTLRMKKRDPINRGEIQFVLKHEMILELLIILSYSLFFLITVRGSNLVHNRYIYPVYPIVALMAVKIINRIVSFFIHSGWVRGMILFFVFAGSCVGSLAQYGVDFMYPDYDKLYQQAQETAGTDCLLYYGKGWLDVYTFFQLRMLHDETYLMRPDDISNVAEILSQKATESGLTVCLPARLTEADRTAILDRIIVQSGLQSYRQAYQYEYLQEWIIE